MAENNQNNGQSEKPQVSFDSAKIADKERVEQFTQISGEKERLAAAERAKKEAERKQEAAREARIEQAIETRKFEQKSEKIERRERNVLYRIFWSGWHKIVTIVLLVVAVAAIFLAPIIFDGIRNSSGAIEKRDEEASALSERKYREAEEKRLGGSFEDAKKVFLDALEKCNREEKIFLTIEYAKYIAKYQYDSSFAYSLLEGVEPEIKNDREKKAIESGFYLIEVFTGDEYEK